MPKKTMKARNLEMDTILEVVMWAYEKGALHIKTPYIEIVFSPDRKPDVVDPPVNSAVYPTEPVNPPPYKNPMDDPDMYAENQETFFNHKVVPR